MASIYSQAHLTVLLCFFAGTDPYFPTQPQHQALCNLGQVLQQVLGQVLGQVLQQVDQSVQGQDPEQEAQSVREDSQVK
jgi:hypothetical protein